MKKILTFIAVAIFAMSSSSLAKDFGDYKIDAELGYAMDGWTNTGTNLNDTRGVGYASIDFEFSPISSFKLLSENDAYEINDDTTSDGSYSLGYSHRITAYYLINNFEIGIFGEVEDFNASQNQGDSASYQGIDAHYNISGYTLGFEYADELSDGSKNDAGTVRYAENIYQYSVERSAEIMGKTTNFELLYTDIDNLRETISFDTEVMLTENFGFGILVGENDGQGAFSSNEGQNRDFAAARVFAKY